MNSDNNQDGEVQKQIEREVRMREGASKLLAACSQREQALEAAKSLLTCNARILALLSQLQRMRKTQTLQRMGSSDVDERLPCTGKLAISDLRIPLMWKDSKYFKNKGDLNQCAVFCLLHCGNQIYDTNLVMVDRTLTDVCFEDSILFHEVDPGFQLQVELYSSSVEDDLLTGSLGPRRLSRLGGSLGRTSGKKIRAALESAASCGNKGDPAEGSSSPPPLLPHPVGPKYQLLAHTTLSIAHVKDSFKTHDLSLAATEDSPVWLPLYGNMCCRLVAQPLCTVQQVISGELKLKFTDDTDSWENIYGVLKGTSLFCYQSEEDSGSEKPPMLKITINKDTIVCVSDKEPLQFQVLYISTQCRGEDLSYTLAFHAPEDTQRWMEVLWQHFYNISQWRHCCDNVMKIEEPANRKALKVKQGTLYHEIVTPSSAEEGLVIQDLSTEICALLSTYYNERTEDE